MSTTFKVSDKFTCPGPRYISLGKYSGEYYRGIIKDTILSGDEVTIDLDGTEGYGSSFLEEAFGGLIRDGVPVELVKKIKFISNEEPDLIDEIQDYINEEAARNIDR
ncbi:STAS-like domain-containing protein [Aeromonas sp. SrichE-2G]|uniref:STAS-like domain-containing protein n=1 Tax=Aeromonas sp. SrichE-2G TaxID=2823359 RepID=UPI001B32B467|nr:STAS-like domain-containing protein [Aeromonas sp. SrichE-2G]MBP4042218.1 STAS-like domain-containing protein [Aeromonas sp. SrichE-2G]